MHNLSFIFVYLQSPFVTPTTNNIQQTLQIIFSLQEGLYHLRMEECRQ
uniref:Uncharacterized protein n=1 Tax=Anguilla anguilla TaxID=7936 RepID=A0A0E9QHB2_ANGAN